MNQNNRSSTSSEQDARIIANSQDLKPCKIAVYSHKLPPSFTVLAMGWCHLTTNLTPLSPYMCYVSKYNLRNNRDNLKAFCSALMNFMLLWLRGFGR